MADRHHASRVVAGLSGLQRAFVEVGDREQEAEPAADTGPTPVEEAFEQGRREGLEEGAARAIEELRAEHDALRAAISASVLSLVDLRDTTTRRHEQAMFELALSAASSMLRVKIEEGDPVASRALQGALAALPGGGPVRARLHPDDIESVRRDLAREIDAASVVLIADDAISRGGCVADGDAGSIDATLETAVALVSEAARGTDAP